MRSAEVPVYQYFFNHPRGEKFLVPHASEIPFVIRSKATKSVEKDAITSDFMATYWGNFLISEDGDPNESAVGVPKADLPQWSSFNNETANEIAFPPEGHPNMQYKAKAIECSYWIPYLSALLHTQFSQ